MKIVRLFITIIIFLSLLLGMSGCRLFDRDKGIVREVFNTELPGFSKIEILKAEGDHSRLSPRVLTFRVIMDVFPEPITADARLTVEIGDPTIAKLEWFSLEGLAYSALVFWAQECLKPGPSTIDKVTYVLKHWIDKGLIKLGDIKNDIMREEVEELINKWDTIPDEIMKAPLLDLTNILIHDLVPDLPQNKKIPIYTIRTDGTISLYLTASVSDSIKMQPNEGRLGTTIPRPPE